MGERMGRRKFLAQAGAGAIAAGAAVRAGAQERPPNFVFILVDDMGWADLPCYGNAFVDTPSIDRLASQGMR